MLVWNNTFHSVIQLFGKCYLTLKDKDIDKEKEKEMKEPFQFTFGDILITVSQFSQTMLEMRVWSPERSFVKYVESDKIGEEVANVCF